MHYITYVSSIALQYSVFFYICIFISKLYTFIFLCCCLVPFHFTLRTLLSTFYKAGLVIMNSIYFCVSGKGFIYPFLKDSFSGYNILSWQLLSSEFSIYHFCPFWPARFLLRNVIVLWGFTYTWQIPFLAAFKIRPLFLTFDNLIIMYLSTDTFESF